jgi:5'-nucleotidase
MRILLTNDDGIHAPGIAVLERIARQISDDIWVVAPEHDQSGLSHSLTLNDPLRLREADPRHFALRGTPSDCVIMAVHKVLGGRKPDLVLSGVNGGQNVADDVTYSGTVAGAIEGTMMGIPSIALSQAFDWDAGHGIVPWETAEAHAAKVIAKLIEFGFEGGRLFNINFPNRPPDKVTGIEITSQGRMEHGLFIDERRDGRGNPYYWLAYGPRARTRVAGTDINAIDNGRISVTPLNLDFTDHAVATRLRNHFG